MTYLDRFKLAIQNRRVCCLIHAMALDYIFSVKKSVLHQISDFNPIHNVAQDDFITGLSLILKKVSNLFVLVDKTYGELVFRDWNDSEINNILQNHRLWEKEWILPKV